MSTSDRDLDDQALIEDFVLAAASLRPGAVGSVLDEMFRAGTFEEVASATLMPALRAVGSAWGDGRLDVAAEHVASGVVQQRLTALFDAAPSLPSDAPTIVVGMPPGARHELGALAFAVMARRAGLDVLYLGADLPGDGWCRAVTETGAVAAVIGVVSPEDAAAARAVAERLSAERPGIHIALGGASAPTADPAAPWVTLPTSLDDAVRSLRTHLAGDAPGGG